jgi:hypothetical protein
LKNDAQGMQGNRSRDLKPSTRLYSDGKDCGVDRIVCDYLLQIGALVTALLILREGHVKMASRCAFDVCHSVIMHIGIGFRCAGISRSVESFVEDLQPGVPLSDSHFVHSQ